MDLPPAAHSRPPQVVARAVGPTAASHWPAGLNPTEAPVYQRNERHINASPERVYAWLARADLWSRYYGNAKGVRVQAPPGQPLARGTRFHWWTFNVPLDTQVMVAEPGQSLAWDARMPGLRAYHQWMLLPEGTGTRVVTEETDTGFVASLAAGLIRSGLKREHQHWLEGLARVAESGPPPGTP